MITIVKDKHMQLFLGTKNMKNIAMLLLLSFSFRSMAAEPSKGEVETRKIMAGLYSSLIALLPLSMIQRIARKF